jgi:hypothetical protein
MPAAEFYPRLLADTGRSKLHLRGVTRGKRLVGIWFRFDWTLSSGMPANFECVDLLELDEHGLIAALHIFYDTAATRSAFEQQTGTSWQPAS